MPRRGVPRLALPRTPAVPLRPPARRVGLCCVPDRAGRGLERQGDAGDGRPRRRRARRRGRRRRPARARGLRRLLLHVAAVRGAARTRRLCRRRWSSGPLPAARLLRPPDRLELLGRPAPRRRLRRWRSLRHPRRQRPRPAEPVSGVAFLCSVDDEAKLTRLEESIESLELAGVDVRTFAARGETSIARAYNRLLRDAADWRYKVYVHQDVVLLNRGLVGDLLRLF